jgi:tetratricopeptide (TPR) repeat protein
MRATESLEFLGMHKLLPIDEGIPFKEIDEYTIAAKTLMVEALLIIATACLRQENRNGASPFIRKAKEISHNYNLGFEAANFLDGVIKMEMKKFKEAKGIFENILRSKKDYAEAYTALGVCRYNIGDTEQAIEDIKKSIELQPDLTSAHMSLYRIEAYKNRSSSSDFGEYWTKSAKRIGVLSALIIIGIMTMVHAVQTPDLNYVNSTTTNYTKQQGTLIQDVNETITSTRNSNLNQLRLAVIIAVIIIILWPSIKMMSGNI